MKRFFYVSLFLIVLLLAFTLNLKNQGNIDINYYFGIQWSVPLFVLMTVPFFAGMLLGILFMTFSIIKVKHQAGKTKKDLAKAEKEVQNLRAMPIRDEV